MAQQTHPTYTADDELDLGREWDGAGADASREALLAWLQKERPHLLRAYDADFLVDVARARSHAQPGR